MHSATATQLMTMISELESHAYREGAATTTTDTEVTEDGELVSITKDEETAEHVARKDVRQRIQILIESLTEG